MSNELQKWQGNLPARLENKIQRWRENHALALGAQQRPEHLASQSRSATQQFKKGEPGEVIWLPRLCAVHGEGWVAAYIRGSDFRFTFVENIRMPERLWRQNNGNAVGQAVEIRDHSKEECPWCGASYRHWGGPVKCGGCGARVCFGRTTAEDYFRCYCGHKGQLRPMHSAESGVTPTLRHGGKAGY